VAGTNERTMMRCVMDDDDDDDDDESRDHRKNGWTGGFRTIY